MTGSQTSNPVHPRASPVTLCKPSPSLPGGRLELNGAWVLEVGSTCRGAAPRALHNLSREGGVPIACCSPAIRLGGIPPGVWPRATPGLASTPGPPQLPAIPPAPSPPPPALPQAKGSVSCWAAQATEELSQLLAGALSQAHDACVPVARNQESAQPQTLDPCRSRQHSVWLLGCPHPPPRLEDSKERQ